MTGQELEDALLEEIRENPALELDEDSETLSELEQQRIVEERQRKSEELEERNGVGEEQEIDWDTLIEAGQMVVRKGVVGGYAFDDMPSFEEHTASSSTLYDELDGTVSIGTIDRW